MTAPAYLNQISVLFASVQSHVIAQRASQGLTPLKTNGFLVGQEQLRREHAAPRIVIVPTGATYSPTRRMSQAYPSGKATDVNPKVFLARLQRFEAHLWGQDTLTPSSPMTLADLTSGFDDCIELERSFLDGLRIYCGNMSNLHIERSEFIQPTDDNRSGRLLVLSFAIETQVSTLPAIPLSYSTTPVPGSSFDVAVTVSTSWQDGSSTSTGTIIVP